MSVRKALVLGGGFDQIGLINALKPYFNEILLVDYFESPIAQGFVAKHFQESTLDIDGVKRIAIQEDVSLIITACTDQAMLTMAAVSQDLNLPCYLSYEKALNVTNKQYMKSIFKSRRIPTAEHSVIIDLADIDNLAIEPPFVVKPADCNSSKGVILVNTRDELLINAKNALSMSRSGTAVIEEFMPGKEVSIDAFVRDGTATVLLTTESIKKPNTTGFTIIGSSYPVQLSDKAIKQIAIIAQRIAEAFGISNGPLLIQAIANDDDVKVIEFSARMGGGTKYRLIEELTGFNIMKAYVNMALGKDFSVNASAKDVFAHLNYCYAYPGRVERLVNFELLKEKGILKDYYEYKALGSMIEKAETSSDRVAGYLVVGSSQEELIEKEAYANKVLRIESSNHGDIMIHDFGTSTRY